MQEISAAGETFLGRKLQNSLHEGVPKLNHLQSLSPTFHKISGMLLAVQGGFNRFCSFIVSRTSASHEYSKT